MLMNRREKRRGATVVESAVVLGVFLMLMFGIFEYGRFLMVLHAANNAARDGARYAVVNGGRPSTFDTADYTDPTGAVYPSVTTYTNARMGGLHKTLDGYAVEVFACDPAGLAQSPQVVRPKPGAAWNQAAFGERIAVRVTGKYKPVTPVLLVMPDAIDIRAVSVAGGEG
ncbi:MAG: pilus assembly protein [Gemmataceae bacterium]|nr:pilus assembly protein [Gemmataceae bacterium]